jgi:hypothetical protein
METMNYIHFAKEFVEANQFMSRTSPDYCTEFPDQYKNASVMSFDTNFGDSFGNNLDIFAIKTLSPYNSVKVY